MVICIRDGHGNGILSSHGNPIRIPWEWEYYSSLGMGKTVDGNRNDPSSHGKKFPRISLLLYTCSGTIQSLLQL